MYLTIRFMKYTFLILCILFHVMDQVSAFTCYTCSSNLGDECHQNPSQTKFQKYCSLSSINSPGKFSNESISILSIVTDSMFQGKYLAEVSAYDCGVVFTTHSRTGLKQVSRACMPQIGSCADLKRFMFEKGFIVESCSRYYSELGNHSVTLHPTFVFFMLCLLTINFM